MNYKVSEEDLKLIEEARNFIIKNDNVYRDKNPIVRGLFELSNKMNSTYIDETKPTSKTILEEANDIIFARAEEKQRQYGPIDESLEDAAIVASMISNESITTSTVYCVLMGLKISRLRWNKKRDTFLDFIGYSAAYEKYVRKTEKNGN